MAGGLDSVLGRGYPALTMVAGWRFPLAAVLLALPFWVVSITPAHACTCEPTTLEEQIAAADLILIGMAVDIRHVEPLPTPEPLSPPNDTPSMMYGSEVVTVAVEEYLKGSGPDTVKHVYVSGLAACQVLSEVGGRYLLFLALGEDDLYRTSTCAGSATFTAYNEADVLARIEQIRQILQGPPPTPTAVGLPIMGTSGGGESGSSLWPVTLAAGVGIALASTALLLRRGAMDGEA